jgi:hypothetical protein
MDHDVEDYIHLGPPLLKGVEAVDSMKRGFFTLSATAR